MDIFLFPRKIGANFDEIQNIWSANVQQKIKKKQIYIARAI